MDGFCFLLISLYIFRILYENVTFGKSQNPKDNNLG